MILVALTGNYGMGKSTVARMFRELGIPTIDTDELVREMLRRPDVIQEIRETFGDNVISEQRVDTRLVADIVFKDAPLRIALENILHGKVFHLVDDLLKEEPYRNAPVVIIEAPVVFERGYQSKFDRIVAVFTSEETAIQRLSERGVKESEILRRLRSQFPSDLKRSKADYAIDNGENMDATQRQVQAVYQQLMDLGKGFSRHGNN